MDAILNASLTGMHSLYFPGVILTMSLGLFVYWFGSKRVLSVFGQVKTIFFYGEFPDYSALSGVPLPKPLKVFDLSKAKPRPYRPFRWNYVQNMALKKMDPDFWIELESTYEERIAQRKALYAAHGIKVMGAQPRSNFASQELMEMVIQFLCARYPDQFNFDKRTRLFHNYILKTSSNIKNIDPWMFLLENVPEDFLITQKDEQTGFYVMTAGIACSALGWNIEAKMGKPLHEIHEVVPDYKEKLSFSMDRFFSKVPADKPIQRGSWGLEVGQPLYMQPEHPHFARRHCQDPNLRVEDIYLRVDWQILRPLPRSQAIVFNYKALFTPLTEFRTEPYVPKLVAKILKEGNRSIMAYKGSFHIEHVAVPALDEWAMEQEEKGLVPKDWNVRTLDEDPFFPGWETKWTVC